MAKIKAKSKDYVYSIDVELKVKERPTKKTFVLMGVKGRILKCERVQDYYIVLVRFRADSMIALMAVTDDHEIVSQEMH